MEALKHVFGHNIKKYSGTDASHRSKDLEHGKVEFMCRREHGVTNVTRQSLVAKLKQHYEAAC